MRLQFPERAAQFLLNPVNLVEKGPPVDIQLAAAQLPIRAQKEMVLKNSVFVFVQRTPAHKTEVGNILLVFEAPNRFPLSAGIRFQRNAANVFFLRSTVAKPRITSAEHRPENAIARGRRA